MASWQPIDGSMIGQSIDVNSTTLGATLGQRVSCKDMASTAYGIGEFVYLKGVANTIVGSAVTFNQNTWATTLTVANAKGPIAIAMSACVAGEYGWYQVLGRAVVKVLAAFASGNVTYLTATAGSLDDAVVAGDEVFSSISVSAIDTPTTGFAEVSISYPFVTDASN